MPRLPVPDVDADNWGSLLNDFLRAGHFEDGSHKGCQRIIDVRAYGAIGNGAADDTLAVQSAIAAAGNGSTVFFPPGVYTVTSPLVLAAHQQSWIGSGSRVSRIQALGSVSPVIQVGSNLVSPAEPCLSGFSITRNLNGQSRTGTIGLLYLHSRHPSLARFSQLSVFGHDTNVVLGSSDTKPAAKTTWCDCEFGDYADNASISLHQIDAIEQTFLNCRIQGFTNIGYRKLAGDARFINCYLGSVSAAFGYAAPQYCADILGGIDTHFLDCVFEDARDVDIRFRGGCIASVIGCLIGGAGGTGHGLTAFPDRSDLYQLQIVGNTFRDYAQPNSSHPNIARAIYLQQNSAPYRVQFVTINGNTIDVQGDFGLWLDGATDVAIAGNTFRYLGNNATAVRIGSGCQRIAVTGNVISMAGTGSSINLDAGANNCCVVGNVCSGRPILDQGTGNTVQANAT